MQRSPAFALSALIWIALAGLPWRRLRGPQQDHRTSQGRSFGRSLLPLALAAPVLIHAFHRDWLALGFAADARVWIEALLVLSAAIWLLAAAAGAAAASGVLRMQSYACAWCVLVPGLPVLAAVLGWGAGGAGSLGSALPWGLGALAQASPLAYAYRVGEGSPPSPWPMLALTLGLLILGLVPGRAESRGEPA